MSPHSALPLAAASLQDVTASAGELPLGAVTDAMDAAYALLFAERVADGGVDAPLLAGIDPAYGNRLKHAGSLHLLPPWLRGIERGTVMDRATLQRDHDFARSPFFDYVVRPEGRFHCLISTPHVTPLQRFHLIVGRPVGRGDFSGSDVRVLHALLPYLGGLIQSGAALFRAQDETAVLQSTLDQIPGNIMVLTGECRVVFANRGAQRVLDLRDGLDRSGAHLKAANLADTVALRRAVYRALGAGADSTARVQVPRSSGCPPFTLVLTTLPCNATHGQEAGMPHGSATHVMVEIECVDSSTALDAASFARGYGLTTKECEVAVLLARGTDLRSAATELGCGYNTVRSHLRSVFGKTDTHRQSDLVRLMLGGPAPAS